MVAPSHRARLRSGRSSDTGLTPGSHQTPFTRSTPALRSCTGSIRPDDPVAAQDRQDVVAVLALRGRDVHLEPVEEAPERLRPVAVVDEPVERREEGRARGRHGLVVGIRMGEQLPALELRRPASASRRSSISRLRLLPGIRSISGYTRSARSQSALLPLPPDDRDLAACVQEPSMKAIFRLPHHRWSSRSKPRVLDLAREQRAAPLELAQDVAPERRVLLQERLRSSAPARLSRAGAASARASTGRSSIG